MWGDFISDTTVFKAHYRRSKLPSAFLDVSFFKKLFNDLNEINKEAMEEEIAIIGIAEDLSPEDKEKYKKLVPTLYKVTIQIVGSRGEYIQTDNVSIFDEKLLPDYIDTVVLDNSIYYKSRMNKDPRCKITVVFDARKPTVFDFNATTSSTPNSSFIEVSGIRQTWIEGSYQKIMNLIGERSTNRDWVHQDHLYDYFLWLLAFPLAFWYLYKLNLSYAYVFSKWSIISQVFMHVYFFGVNIFFFRFVFNYTRWIYPYLEIKTSLTSVPMKHRAIHGAIFLAIAIDLIKHILFS